LAYNNSPAHEKSSREGSNGHFPWAKGDGHNLSNFIKNLKKPFEIIQIAENIEWGGGSRRGAE
jgi:hypothetical protein